MVAGYLLLQREWRAGDRLELSMAMPVRRLYSTPQIGTNQGRVALARGPLVYCLEGADNGAALNSLSVPRTASFRCEPMETLGGAVGLMGEGLRDMRDAPGLYHPEPPQPAPAPLTLIPYFAWDNRDPGEMLVWFPEQHDVSSF